MSINDFKMDKTAFAVYKLGKQPPDYIYWLTRSPAERIEGAELLRAMIHGEDRLNERLPRLLTITQRGKR